MKRTLLFCQGGTDPLVLAGMALVASTYGLVRLTYGLFLPNVQASLHLSPLTAGYIASSASIAYCVGALCGLTAPRHARRLVLGALATAGIGSIGMAAATGVPGFALSATLASTGAGLASPALVVVIERSVARPRQDRAQATVNAGTGPGLVAAGLLAVALLPHWRLGLTISAVVTAVAGAAVLRLERVPAATSTPVPGPPTQVPTRGWVRPLLVPAAAAALLGASSAAVWTYGRSQLVSQGASGSASTLAWIALGLGGTVTVVTSPVLTRWHPARAWMVTAGVVAAAIAVLGLAADRLTLAMLACAVFGWGFVAATSALISWAARLVPDQAAPGTSLLFITLVLGQAGGSAAIGSIAERHGMTAAFLVAAAGTVLAAALGHRRADAHPASPTVSSLSTPATSSTSSAATSSRTTRS